MTTCILVGFSGEGGVLAGYRVRCQIVTAPHGQIIERRRVDLSRAYDYPLSGKRPDTNVTIVSPRAVYIFGRSGAIRLGSPGLNIIGLNMCD